MFTSNSSDEEDKVEIKINKEFAKKYKQRKEKEELSRCEWLIFSLSFLIIWFFVVKEKFKDEEEEEDESDQESEDEEGKNDLPEWDAKFFEIIPKIVTQDPEIYEEKEFFEEIPGDWPQKKKKKNQIEI